MPGKDSPIKIILVDDEIEACDNLKSILEDYVEVSVSILGTANDTTEAEHLIKMHDPDAVFLDIEMPDENAFQFLERLVPYDFEIVFVTAYDEYAIKAFKLNAVDYILKPICIDELDNAMQKLKERVDYRFLVKHAEHQIKTLKEISNKEPQHKIVLRTLNHIEIVEFKDIYYIEGLGRYCKIFFHKENTLREITMSNIISDYEEILPKDLFYRIHKSYMVNCAHVSKIMNEHTYEVVVKNKITLPVGRRRYSDFIRFLKEHNFHIE